MNRIEINGVWYVKEDTLKKKHIEIDPTHFEGCIVENDEFCFEATRINNDKGSFYDTIDIKFTDKRVKPWKEDHWDGNLWMKGVLNNEPDSLEALSNDLESEDIRFFQAFLQYLTDKKWL